MALVVARFPLGKFVVAELLLAVTLPSRREAIHPKIDYLGAATLAAALSIVVLLCTLGGTSYPWGSPTILGLGVFIARTLLERTGAKVSFTNRIFPDHGAVVQIAWPRSRFEEGESHVDPMP